MVDGNAARAAVMINAQPADPWSDPSFTTPLSHLGDFKWHSDLDYLGIAAVKTGTVDLNINSSGWDRTTGLKTLVAHGQSYTPILVGYVTIDGINVPTSGAFLVSRGGQNGEHCMFDIFADATNIHISCYSINRYIAQTRSIGYTIYVCNMGFDSGGNFVRPPLFNGFDCNPATGYLKCGRFNTAYGYFNKNPSGALRLYRGASLGMEIGSPVYDGISCVAVGPAQAVNGYSNGNMGTVNVGWAPGSVTSGRVPLFNPTTVSLSADFTAGGSAPLDIQSGSIKFGGGFDTGKNTFLITNAISTTVTIPSLKTTNGSGYTDSTVVVDVANVHALATDVMGQYTIGPVTIKNIFPSNVTLSGQTYPLPGTHPVFSRFIHMYPGYSSPGAYSGYTTGPLAMSIMMFLHWRISGGKLQLISKVKMPAWDGSTIPAMPVAVRALVGTFDF